MSLEAVQGASASIEAVEVSCPESPYRKCSSKVFFKRCSGWFCSDDRKQYPFYRRHLAAMSDVKPGNQLRSWTLSS